MRVCFTLGMDDIALLTQDVGQQCMQWITFFLSFFSLRFTLGENLTLWCLMPDTERPQVQLSTTSLAKTKNHFVPVLIQFTEPVFGFASSGVTISGGTLTRQVHEKNPDCFYWGTWILQL